jgi:hypothetical protein
MVILIMESACVILCILIILYYYNNNNLKQYKCCKEGYARRSWQRRCEDGGDIVKGHWCHCANGGKKLKSSCKKPKSVLCNIL